MYHGNFNAGIQNGAAVEDTECSQKLSVMSAWNSSENCEIITSAWCHSLTRHYICCQLWT